MKKIILFVLYSVGIFWVGALVTKSINQSTLDEYRDELRRVESTNTVLESQVTQLRNELDASNSTVMELQARVQEYEEQQLASIEEVTTTISLDEYKACATQVSVQDLFRYPDSFNGQYITGTAKITQVDKDDIFGYTYSQMYFAIMDGETIILDDIRQVKEPTIKEGDTIVFYGKGDGLIDIDVKTSAYQGSLVFGFSYDKTVDIYEAPQIDVDYFEIK